MGSFDIIKQQSTVLTILRRLSNVRTPRIKPGSAAVRSENADHCAIRNPDSTFESYNS